MGFPPIRGTLPLSYEGKGLFPIHLYLEDISMQIYCLAVKIILSTGKASRRTAAVGTDPLGGGERPVGPPAATCGVGGHLRPGRADESLADVL